MLYPPLAGVSVGPIIVIIAIVAVAFWLVGAYNGLIALKFQTQNALKQIDVQLKRRHDLIPNLLEAVKGAMQFEKQTLQAVVEARNQALKVSGGDIQNVARMAAAEQQLTGALGKLLAVVEAYPDLKATNNIGQLQEELTSTENKIGFARQLYNDTATQYNTRQHQFPTSLVAGLAGAMPAELWEITDDAEKAVPKVDLGMK
ncbi:MAG: LemA family protein [Gemmatimonadaceae bacterium]|nr:LemA family protein [Gemmatimonadaceae bacterium]